MSENEAAQLHRESIIIDGLNASYFFEKKVLERLKSGGITAVNATIAAWHTLPETISLIADYHYLFDRHADLIMPVHRVEDIQTAKKTQRVGLIFGFQDTSPIQDNERLLSVYHDLGVKIIQLTYNLQNLVGGGCMLPEDRGLTAFGLKVIAEMNRLGILIDLSHCGPRTSLETIEESRTPVAFTHANALAIAAHPRNKTDEALKALTAKGGVVGAATLPAMLTGHKHATIDDYLSTIDYLVNLLGIDHVGLGPDFMEDMPEEILSSALKGLSTSEKEKYFSTKVIQGFESISECPRVTSGLLARGYSMGQVKKIMGGNWLRLYEEVWH